MHSRIVVLVGLILLTSSVVKAQNLVVNSGFETGDFTGWTVSGAAASVDPKVGYGSKYAAAFGAPISSPNELTQTLATTPGNSYDLNFFAQTPEFGQVNAAPNLLAVYFDGNLISGPMELPNTAQYLEYKFTVHASSSSSALRFVIANDPDYTLLDNIRVSASTPNVPEPGAISFLGAGALSGLMLFGFRRKNSKAGSASK